MGCRRGAVGQCTISQWPMPSNPLNDTGLRRAMVMTQNTF
jgi:hypothetical protein